MAHASPNLQRIHDFLFELALKAGDMITSANPTKIDTKKNSSDLVTETDKAVEDMVSSTLKKEYPDYAFLGEETAPPSGTVPNGPCFIVDPIDGTTNFVHAHPYISISLCFAIDRVPQIGIIYNPFTQHLYHAITSHGAYLTCPSIPTSHPPLPSSTSSISTSTSPQTSSVTSHYSTSRLPLRSPPPPLPFLDKALVAVEWGNERSGANFSTKLRVFATLAASPSPSSSSSSNNDPAPHGGSNGEIKGGKMAHSLRSLGSAALNCCAVARGDLDVYWEGGCWAWDVGAGMVIVREAGGCVVSGNPGGWDVEVDGRCYLVVRAVGDSAGGQGKGINEEQKRVIESVWEAVRGEGGEGKLVY